MSCFGECKRVTLEWLQYRTCMERILMGIFCFLFIVVIIVASFQPESTLHIPDACNTSICLNEASKILRLRRKSVNACKNIYTHACGNFQQNAEGKEKVSLRDFQNQQLLEFYYKEIRNEDHYVIKTAKKLFQSCMKQREQELKQVETLKSVLEQAGGWPVVNESWSETKFDWVKASYKLRELGYTYDIFMDLTVETDPANQYSYIYKTSTADLTDYLYELHELEKIELMTEIALMFGAKDRKQAYQEMSDAYKFWKLLNQNHYPAKSKEFERMKLKDFQSKFGSMFDWISFNNIISGKPYKLSRHHDQLFPPIMNMIHWLKTINGTTKRTQANYMMWKVVEETIPYMHCELRLAKGGVRKYESFEEFCLRETEKRFVISPMRLIIDRIYLTEVKRKHFEELLSHIQSAFMELLEKAKWIEEHERETYYDRVKYMDFIISRSNHHYGDDILDQLVVDMMEIRNVSFMELIAQANRNYVSMKYNQFRIDRSDSLLDKLYINNLEPKYISEHNILFIPGAILQMYFDEDKPNYLSYGEIGALLGSRFAETIREVINRTEWPANTKEEFEKDILCLEKETQDCIERQLLPPEMCHGRSVQLAKDAVGIKIAYSAYNKLRKKKGEELPLVGTEYTQDQLFWMSAGAICCPRDFNDNFQRKRVFLAIANDDNFNEAFKCPKRKKC